MARLKDIVARLDGLLELDKFKTDDSNNGLQFEGRAEVSKAVFGVDACAALFDRAKDEGADFIFVHHGISWGSRLKRIVGLKSRRISALAANGMSLYAAHLPLDANPRIGHNILIAGMLGLKHVKPFGEYAQVPVGYFGDLHKPSTPEAVAELLDGQLASSGKWKVFGEADKRIKRVGVVSGGGCWPELLEELIEDEIDCLVTGEVGHSPYHAIAESGVSVVAMGHYRSETPGVLATMEILQKSFKIPCSFIDIPTGL